MRSERETRNLERVLESERFRGSFKKMKIMITRKNTTKVSEKRKFSYAVYIKGVGTNSIICSCIIGKLKEDSKLKAQTYVNQQKNIEEDCLGIEFTG